MERVLTIQDLSCVGKCSLTAALPVLSVMGVEACALPTAVLSTHTMFSDVYLRDLTEDMLRVAAHWQAKQIRFNALYSGYLASERQAALTQELFRMFGGEGVKIIVDPAMADGGKLYSGFDAAFPAAMRGLCARADVVLPNLTEAAMLLQRPYPGEDCGVQTVLELARLLTDGGPSCAVVTGVRFPDGMIGAVGFDRTAGEAFEARAKRVRGKFHATGDLFSAALTGGLVRGLSVKRAAELAACFVSESLRQTPADRPDAFGPCFELALPWLAERLDAALRQDASFAHTANDEIMRQKEKFNL